MRCGTCWICYAWPMAMGAWLNGWWLYGIDFLSVASRRLAHFSSSSFLFLQHFLLSLCVYYCIRMRVWGIEGVYATNSAHVQLYLYKCIFSFTRFCWMRHINLYENAFIPFCPLPQPSVANSPPSFLYFPGFFWLPVPLHLHNGNVWHRPPFFRTAPWAILSSSKRKHAKCDETPVYTRTGANTHG